MRILYGYSNCTDETYNRIMSERNASAMQPDQKYHSLVIRGLAENGAEVRCISGLPINRAVTARKLVREKDEQDAQDAQRRGELLEGEPLHAVGHDTHDLGALFGS